MNDKCAVPVYNVYASCLWLKRFGLAEDYARIIIYHGDSMKYTLNDDDEVLVDIRELDHRAKRGVYLMRIGKHVYIKRLKYDIMAEGYEVISDNREEYSSFIVNEEKLKEFAVIGKVVTTVMKAVI
ncbi:S24 family peptidase [Vibrio sonorensis]|uniref:S24 family peptidase n=1 Tax=Vibrio sonorensis TaxID=1004316 RepID=UPI0011139BCA|nr:S24 family peptidase [Vibrio sonorensis]